MSKDLARICVVLLLVSWTSALRADDSDTSSNYETLESAVTDPNDPEDALKIDADEYGEGGDDAFDMVRYGLASRPLNPRMKKERTKRDPNFDHKAERVLRRNQTRRRRRIR